jgi:hypothetical protein
MQQNGGELHTTETHIRGGGFDVPGLKRYHYIINEVKVFLWMNYDGWKTDLKYRGSLTRNLLTNYDAIIDDVPKRLDDYVDNLFMLLANDGYCQLTWPTASQYAHDPESVRARLSPLGYDVVLTEQANKMHAKIMRTQS